MTDLQALVAYGGQDPTKDEWTTMLTEAGSEAPQSHPAVDPHCVMTTPFQGPTIRTDPVVDGLGDSHDWQDMENEESEVCTQLMSPVIAREVAGRPTTNFWRDVLADGARRR